MSAYGAVRIAEAVTAGGRELAPGDEAFVELADWEAAGQRGTTVTLYARQSSDSRLGPVPGYVLTEWYPTGQVVEIGTSRSLAVVGRDLANVVATAVVLAERGEPSAITRDGHVVAWISAKRP